MNTPPEGVGSYLLPLVLPPLVAFIRSIIAVMKFVIAVIATKAVIILSSKTPTPFLHYYNIILTLVCQLLFIYFP